MGFQIDPSKINKIGSLELQTLSEHFLEKDTDMSRRIISFQEKQYEQSGCYVLICIREELDHLE